MFFECITDAIKCIIHAIKCITVKCITDVIKCITWSDTLYLGVADALSQLVGVVPVDANVAIGPLRECVL